MLSTKNSQRRDLTQGGVVEQLVRLTSPVIIGVFAVLSISIADTYFIGQLGTNELAAIGFVYPVAFILMSIAIGLGAGSASVIARAIGKQAQDEVKRLSTYSIILAFIGISIISLLGYLTIRPMFSLMGAEGEVLDIIERYMRIWYPGLMLLVMPMVANSIIRATGDTFSPSMIMVTAAVVNIVLDPIFIFGWGIIPAMNVEGAAWASVIARAVTLIAAFSIIVFREKLIIFQFESVSLLLQDWWRVLTIAVPAAIGNMVNPLGIAIITAILASLGAETVAGYGVATRIESFAMIPMLALSAAIGPFVGQNFGAQQMQRIRHSLQACAIFCIGWSAFIAVLFVFVRVPVNALFTDNTQALLVSNQYLLIVPLSFAGYGIITIVAAAYNAIGRPMIGLGYYLLRTAGLYVPLVALLVPAQQLDGLYWSAVVANLVAGVFTYFHGQHLLCKKITSKELNLSTSEAAC